MTTLNPARDAGPTLPAGVRPVMRQVGWLGQSGTVYAYSDEPHDGREPGGYHPLYLQLGVWEDLGDGRFAVRD